MCYCFVTDKPIPSQYPPLLIQLFGGPFVTATASVRRQIWESIAAEDLLVRGTSVFGERVATKHGRPTPVPQLLHWHVSHFSCVM